MAQSVFAKMSADLDVNPKIRAAGRDGREVFLFVLRVNSLLNAPGAIPMSYIAPEYLADVLMMTESDARNGVSRCFVTSLLTRDDELDAIRITGWSDAYARRPMTGAERQAALRVRKKQNRADVVTDSNATVTDAVTRNGCNTLDQIRSDQKKRVARDAEPSHQPLLTIDEPRATARLSPADEMALEFSSFAVGLINAATGRDFTASRKSTLKLCKALLKAGHTRDDVSLVVESKAAEWLGGRMAERVCPATLFALDNFETYLDEAKAGPPRSIAVAVNDPRNRLL